MSLQILGTISSITILDLVDISLVAYLLYKVYFMLRDTRAATLFKGLIILVLFMLLCHRLNLHVISWLMDKSVTMILVTLPVVFQPELRRALERIGQHSLFHQATTLNDQQIEFVLDQVGMAVAAMSKDKVGALIVFERNTGLVDRIETGVPIDGLVSNGLLQNIFVKDTPLHDGAVIIRENRVVAACCLLPLTDNRNLSQELGTRHRAGIGMSEQSDAVVLIVSEETGAISIARNGELQRYLTIDDIKGMLRDKLYANRKPIGELILERIKKLRGEAK